MSVAACAANWQNGQWSSQSPAGETGAPLSSPCVQSHAASPNVALSSATIAAGSGAASAGGGLRRLAMGASNELDDERECDGGRCQRRTDGADTPASLRSAVPTN